MNAPQQARASASFCLVYESKNQAQFGNEYRPTMRVYCCQENRRKLTFYLKKKHMGQRRGVTSHVHPYLQMLMMQNKRWDWYRTIIDKMRSEMQRRFVQNRHVYHACIACDQASPIRIRSLSSSCWYGTYIIAKFGISLLYLITVDTKLNINWIELNS